MNKARRLADNGKYEEALREHIDFHDNILKTQPAMYGVRLSFALSHWIELGQKYPKALTALKDIRDKKTARLAGGEANRDLFHDVEAINDHLSEQDETVALFRKIAATSPTFARDVYDMAEEALVQKREFELARQYMGDPGSIFNTAKTNYEQGMAWAKRGTARRASENAYRNIFTDDVVRLILILKNTGDEERAKAIQAEALKIADHERIRDVFEPASAAPDRSQNRLPENIRSVLNGAEFTLLSLNPVPVPESENKSKATFHNYEVLGKTVVRDGGARTELLRALDKGIEEWNGRIAACFNPRHGISATHGGKTIDLVICFECQSIRTYAESAGNVLTSGSAQPTFDAALKKAGLPIASAE